MKIVVTANYQQSCLLAADMIRDAIAQKPNTKLGLATGSTPLPVYSRLVEMHKAGAVDFARVCTVNLDEYCGLAPTHPQSYRYFMDKNLFNHININKANTFVASGLGDYEANAQELDRKVEENGPTDLQVLGIGNNGHIAFNEARAYVVAASHVETLTQSTIEANARFFDNKEDVPTQAITMGMRGILASRLPLMIATGANKAQAMRGLLLGQEVTPHNPATFLKLHPAAVILVDEELAALAGYTA